MKTTIAVLIGCIYLQYMVGQSYYSKLYNYQNTKEFDSELVMLKNGNVLAIGGLETDPYNFTPRGILLREINPKNGDLVSENFIVRDSLSLHIAGLKHCNLLNDSTIIITGTAQYKEMGYYDNGTPFFLKYDLNNNKELSFKLFEGNIGGEFLSSLLHIDNHIYCVGFQYSNNTERKDKLFIKTDLEGNLVWKKIFDDAEKEAFTEAESFGNNLILCGLNSVFGVEEQEQLLTKFDTSGVMLKNTVSHLSGIFGISQTEISDSAIFYTATAKVGDWHINDTQYLIRYDSDLNIVWDTLIPITNTFDIRLRSLKIADNQLITMSAITDADIFTKNKVWNYTSSWSFDGKFNWEHANFYDSTYTHHLDDVLVNEDKMIFLGTVFSYPSATELNQSLWLYNTDLNGCSPVLEDTCLFSLDDYFPRPPCTANAGLDWASCGAGSGKEFLGAYEVVEGGQAPYTYQWHTDHPLFSSRYYLEDVNVAKPKVIPYRDWIVPFDTAVNFILTVTDSIGTTCTDTVKYLGYVEYTNWSIVYPYYAACNIQPGDSCLLSSHSFPFTETATFDWLSLGLYEYNANDPQNTCCPYVNFSESSTSYPVIITDENGCVDETISNVTDVNETTKQQTFTLYPNPVSKNELLHIDFPDNLKVAHINLYNHAGKMIRSQKMDVNSNSLYVNELSAGIYFIKFQHDNQILQTGKLMVKP